MLKALLDGLPPELHMLPMAPSPASVPQITAIPSTAAMASDLPDTPVPQLPEGWDRLPSCSSQSPEAMPVTAQLLAPGHAAPAWPTLPASPRRQAKLPCPLLPQLLGRSKTSSLPSLLQLVQSPAPLQVANSDPDLTQLTDAHEPEQLLEADFTMRACPDLLPLPYLACLDAPSHTSSRACQLVLASLQVQSTSNLELYLDWSSTSSALSTAVKRITEASPLPDPRLHAPVCQPGRVILEGMEENLPPGLQKILHGHRAFNATAATAWLRKCGQALSQQPAQAAGTTAGHPHTAPPQAKAPAPATGLGYFVSLQHRKPPPADAATGSAHAPQGSTHAATGPQRHTAGQEAAQTLSAPLPASHARLLGRLQACDADLLVRSSTGPL